MHQTARRDFIKKAALAGTITSLLPVSLQALPKGGKKDRKRSLRIAHITDVHILDQPNAESLFAQVLREINNMDDKPDFIINTGDTVMDENKQTRETVAARWQAWHRVAKKENKLPMYSALGNHDVWYGPDEKLDTEYRKDKLYGKAWAMQELAMPSRYYSFSKNGWHFIALDSINGTEGYQLDQEQVQWLHDELKKVDASTPVCVFSHVPILSMGALLYATKRKPLKEVSFPSADMHNDHHMIKDIFLKHKNVKLCLSGHVHYVDGIEYLGVKYLCNGAVSGNWWREPLHLDDFPPVYTVVDLFADGSIAYQHFYYNTKA